MKAIIFYILAISLSLIHNQDYYGNECESKDLVGIDEVNPAADYTAVHHSVASCASLYAYEDDDNTTPMLCCYAKIKYKIQGEKFTRKGCTRVDPTKDIDEEIKDLEDTFNFVLQDYYNDTSNSNVEIKDIDADIYCNSKFIKYSVLLILIAFL